MPRWLGREQPDDLYVDADDDVVTVRSDQLIIRHTRFRGPRCGRGVGRGAMVPIDRCGRAGRDPLVRGRARPTLTAADQALSPPMTETFALPLPCRVDHEAADGEDDDAGAASGGLRRGCRGDRFGCEEAGRGEPVDLWGF